MPERQDLVIPATEGAAFVVRRGEIVKVIDVEGHQIGGERLNAHAARSWCLRRARLDSRPSSPVLLPRSSWLTALDESEFPHTQLAPTPKEVRDASFAITPLAPPPAWIP